MDPIVWVILGGVVLLLVFLPLLARGGRARTERSRVSGWRTRAGEAVDAGADALAAVRSRTSDAGERLKAFNASLHALAATPPDAECKTATNDLVAATRGLRAAVDEGGDITSAADDFEAAIERLRTLAG